MHRKHSLVGTLIAGALLLLVGALIFSLVSCLPTKPSDEPTVDNSSVQKEQEAIIPEAPTDVRSDPLAVQSPEYLAQYEAFKQAVAPHMTTEAGGTNSQYYADGGVLVIKDAQGDDLVTLTAEQLGITSPEKVESAYAMTARSGRVLRVNLMIDGQEFSEALPNT